MGVDPRQIVAAILTVTMFVMLGNMITRDHFASLPVDSDISIHSTSKQSLENGPWIRDGASLKPCWTKPVPQADQSQGFVTFSLTNGPEYHVSQIADAVIVARYLRATLVIPDIRGSKPGDKRNFEDIYDVEHFVRSLDGVVKVAKTQPTEVSARNLAVVKVPNRVSEDYIAENIEPVFTSKGNIRLATYFPSVNMKKMKEKSNIDSIACMAMFGTLELQPEVNEVVESMVERLRTLSAKSKGQFIAVDLRADILERKSCQGDSALKSKSCYGPEEIGMFLRKVGFNKDTTLYLTQSRWDSSLDALKDLFPKTYTKESIMPIDKKAKFLVSESSELEKVINFYMCSESDIFVPAISGLFYANVAGKRIASGKTQILVPADIPGSSAALTDHISHYVSKKNHFAYSCFC
ncbi:protein MANNAN SYNTHESIS-RELATED 1-like isoform X2 [Lycium ferocissimum]|uniref:protein MANNAN SYNTHESIS-RELATED 1-like isoform X2 n=1 Tax=Lycium ferocissimum TaxID=112874 RepID=UPI0028168947|nr:protein MANNAN SYNTHESIS-RELATED 1-like isoform X2 [Lycium ferocissimum]